MLGAFEMKKNLFGLLHQQRTIEGEGGREAASTYVSYFVKAGVITRREHLP